MEKLSDDIVIYEGDCKDIMRGMESESIDLVITSPPYFNLREYSTWKTYDDYIRTVGLWFKELARVIKTGRYIFWNIQDSYPNRLFDKESPRKHLPLTSDTIQVATDYINYEGNIIWYKGAAGATQRMFGSYPYPPTLILSWLHENILVFRKEGRAKYDRNEESKLSKEEWVYLTNSVWEFPPETSSEHSAPFPVELPTRAIKGWSLYGDTVLDPFMGSATTGVACLKTGRIFKGIDISKDYYSLGKTRLQKITMQPRLL